jgi:Meiotically up-regulated gene 113
MKRPIVYVMQGWGKPEWYKIGCSENILVRYQSKRSRAMIVCVIPAKDKYELEAAIHGLFSFRRIDRREVFALTEDDLKCLRVIASAEDPLKEVRKLAAGPRKPA